MRALLLAVLCLGCEAGLPIASQSPTIVPSGGEFVGEVKGGVRIVPNSQWDSTRIFYTVGTCDDAAKSHPDPENAGIDQITKELKGRESIPMSAPGQYCVTAVAVTIDQKPSDPSRASFNILRSLYDTPTISPAQGKYYGHVEVTISGKEGADVRYDIDRLPTANSPKYSKPFRLAAFGEHHVSAVAFYPGGGHSPVAEVKYQVALPVSYAVAHDPSCTDCKGPTVGRPFVVMLQGVKALPTSLVFLSTVKCAGTIHELNGCNCPTGVSPKGSVLKVTSFDAPTDNVYVCFSPDGGQSWHSIPNQLRSENLEEKAAYSFTLHPAPGGSVEPTRRVGIGSRVEDAPFDWEGYRQQQASKRKSSSDILTPAVVVFVVLGTGLYMMFKKV